MAVPGCQLHVSPHSCPDPELIRKRKYYWSFLISIAIDMCVWLFAF